MVFDRRHVTETDAGHGARGRRSTCSQAVIAASPSYVHRCESLAFTVLLCAASVGFHWPDGLLVPGSLARRRDNVWCVVRAVQPPSSLTWLYDGDIGVPIAGAPRRNRRC